ncbi:hypothetical protein MAPG_05874 [Magnaporthiopsis poae ATCC 64411]|uniref:AA1-like domain-containing protein n=1 Tax=Magnaporthiopsis poae (strain ATCC 64411 / 73-15) TaxID=644358 RepID=A0A0C4E0J7_MAGP6|nr:hypothetical protein MAPG_05874 [Magnaporthiopsis poae ATCC 64411]
MRFATAAAAALFGAALAAPAPNPDTPPKFDPREKIILQDFQATISGGDKNVTSIKFNILAKRDTGDKTFTCSGSGYEKLTGPDYPYCQGGGPRYDRFSFRLRSHPVNKQFDLVVFHQTADAFGSWGYVTVNACCDAKNVCLKDQTEGELHFYE